MKILFYCFCAIFLVSGFAFGMPSEKSWDEVKVGTPKGTVFSYRFTSNLLKNRRDIWVYVPPSYHKQNQPYPLLVVFDGEAYNGDLIPGPTILDNLIAAGEIPPLVTLFISSIGQDERNRELPCYAPFVDSLVNELLPWLHKNYRVTSDPSYTIVGGSSYGGLAAAYAALRYPERFGNVLSQSGAYWWQPSQKAKPWLIQQFATRSMLPIHFYLDVGDKETEKWEDGCNMITINRQFRDVLLNKGYQVTYQEFEGDHDYDCWRKTFATGLIALVKNWNKK